MARWVRVACVQFASKWALGKADARDVVLRELRSQMESLNGLGADLVVFSEGVQAVGQTVSQAEDPDEPGPILGCYRDMARALSCTVAGSVKLKEDSRTYNSIVYIGPDGEVLGVYHKIHLIKPEMDAGLHPGQFPTAVQTPVGRLGGLVCFDLNFVELCETYRKLNVDILVFPSMFHGGLMQAWWAYQCRCYFVSALPFSGAGVISPLGESLASTDCYNSIAVEDLNLDRAIVHLDHHREKFADIRRDHGDAIRIHVPANLGVAMLTSQCDDLSAMDIVRSYELQLVDAYFAEARELNRSARQRGGA